MSGLTEKQHAYRKLVIGGSDATIIMGGDDEAVLRLWREKRGEAEREDLSRVLPVRMGIATEQFNAEWFEETTGRGVTRRGWEYDSFVHHWMACTIDGLTDDEKTVWEAKHVNAFAKPEEVRDRYFWQLQHNMIVTGMQHSVLSVFIGTFRHEVIEVPADPASQALLIDAERHFWECVQSGEPPVAVATPVPVEPVKKEDMTGRNDWASAAADWLENQGAAKKFDSAAKAIKSLIEPDVLEASGHGIRAKKSKTGAISIKGI